MVWDGSWVMGYGMVGAWQVMVWDILRMDGWTDCHDGAWIYRAYGETVYKGYGVMEVEKEWGGQGLRWRWCWRCVGIVFGVVFGVVFVSDVLVSRSRAGECNNKALVCVSCFELYRYILCCCQRFLYKILWRYEPCLTTLSTALNHKSHHVVHHPPIKQAST